MNFLPYILFWLVGRASGQSKLNACQNNKSGNEGICLSESLCIHIGGLNIRTCTFSRTKKICCKIFGVNNASSVNLQNIISSYEESETYSTSSMRKTVLLPFHDLQNTVDTDKASNSREILTDKSPHNVNQNYSNDSLSLSFNLDRKLKNHFPSKSKEFAFKSVEKYPQMPEKNLSRNQIQHWKKIKHNLHKQVNRKGLNFNKPLEKQEYHDLRHPVELHVTDDNQNPVQTDSTFYLQKSVQINSPQNIQKQVLIALDPIHRKFVKEATTRDIERTTMLTADYLNRNSIQIQPISDLQKSVKTDIAFYLEKPVQVNPSLTLRTEIKDSDSHDSRRLQTQKFSQDLRNFKDINTINISREPTKTYSTFSLQKSLQADLSHELHKVVKLPNFQHLQSVVIQKSNNDLRTPAKINVKNYLRKRVQTDPTFYLQKPVQVHPSHNLRKAVKVADSHDLRSPIVQEPDHDLRSPVVQAPDHDLRKPVEVHRTNYLRKPVQLDSTFYLQKPVQVHSSHNLRKVVKVADSHDLRWPVVQEPDHDLRSPAVDLDYFRSENEEAKLDKIIQEYAKKTYKDGKKEESYDPIYELVHEDDRIKSKCEHEIWNWNNRNSENRTHLENQDKAFKQKISFRNSTQACGIPYNESKENLDFKDRNSNMGPWMVSVQEYSFGKFRHKCGGSLLNNIWVITAAHCVDLRPKWDFLLKFRTESNGKSQKPVERLVNKISIHPKYNNINFDNDIALLRMELPVTFQSNIVPICLPDSQERMVKKKAVIFGWKVTTRRDKSSGEAQAETVPVLTNKECEVMFSETGVSESIEKNFVCAGARSVKESCTGDSGGPLAILDTRGRWSLAGLYSWGKSCKIPNQPEVYISVESYVNWIEDSIACFEHYINLSKIND